MVVGQCTTVDLKSLTKLMYSILVATQAHTEWQMRHDQVIIPQMNTSVLDGFENDI